MSQTPYKLDLAVCKNLLDASRTQADSVLGPFIIELGQQLTAAIEEIKQANQRARIAEVARVKAEAELENAQQAVSRLRSGSSGVKDAIDALTSISLNPKGASKLAKDTLAKINVGRA